MSLKIFIAILVIGVVHSEPQYKVSLEKVEPGQVQPKFLLKDWNTTYATLSKYVPPDDGYSNYGDLIHLRRGPTSSLIYSEIFDTLYANAEQQFVWRGSFPGYTITQVRLLNLGRQRAWCSSISTSGGDGNVNFSVAPNRAARVIIDVYVN